MIRQQTFPEDDISIS